MDEDIINYVKKELNLAIGEETAEQIKKEIGCATPLMSQMTMKIKGRDLNNGLPRTEIITSDQVEHAMKESINILHHIVLIFHMVFHFWVILSFLLAFLRFLSFQKGPLYHGTIIS